MSTLSVGWLFFSSRRRHTRLVSDWSSDVCSSDLRQNAEQAFQDRRRTKEETAVVLENLKRRLALARIPRRIECYDISHFQGATIVASQRSEERRVGKEWR